MSQNAFDAYRFWVVGTLAGRPLSVLAASAPVLLVGAVLAIALARPLNAHTIVTPELVADLFGLRCRVIADPESGAPLVIPSRRPVRR